MRTAFNFYRSYYEVAKELKDKDKFLFLWALIEKQFTNKEPNLKGMAKLAYLSQSHSVNKQIKGWQDKTGLPMCDPCQGSSDAPIKGKSKGSKQQGKEKGKVKEKGEGKVKEIYPTLDEAKEFFGSNGYTEDSAVSFFNYYNDRDWFDKNKQKVKSWKDKARKVWFKEQHLKREPVNESVTGTAAELAKKGITLSV